MGGYEGTGVVGWVVGSAEVEGAGVGGMTGAADGESLVDLAEVASFDFFFDERRDDPPFDFLLERPLSLDLSDRLALERLLLLDLLLDLLLCFRASSSSESCCSSNPSAETESGSVTSDIPVPSKVETRAVTDVD